MTVRIIVERDKNCRWAAHWHDEPDEAYISASALGAVAKLLLHSSDRHVALSDVVTDPSAYEPGYIEMVVMGRAGEMTDSI